MIVYPYTDTGIVRTIVVGSVQCEGPVVGGAELALLTADEWPKLGIILSDIEKIPTTLICVRDYTIGEVVRNLSGVYACLTNEDFLKWKAAVQPGEVFLPPSLEKDDRGLEVLIAVKKFDSVEKGMYTDIDIVV